MQLDYTPYMKRAYEMAIRSFDPSTQNGAVVVHPNGEIIGGGFNAFPEGVAKTNWYGDKQAKYDRVVHAEMTALLEALCSDHLRNGLTLVCPWAACSNCAKHIAFCGMISTLVRHKESNTGLTTGEQWHADCALGDELLIRAGIKIVEIDPVPYDIAIRRNGSLWVPEGNVVG